MRRVSAAAASASSADSLSDNRAGDALWRPSAVTHFNSADLKEVLMKHMLDGRQEAGNGDGASADALHFSFFKSLCDLDVSVALRWHYLRNEVNTN